MFKAKSFILNTLRVLIESRECPTKGGGHQSLYWLIGVVDIPAIVFHFWLYLSLGCIIGGRTCTLFNRIAVIFCIRGRSFFIIFIIRWIDLEPA